MNPLGVLIFSSLMLGACMSKEEALRADSETCRSIGFIEKTEAFSNCLLDLELSRRGQAVTPRRR